MALWAESRKQRALGGGGAGVRGGGGAVDDADVVARDGQLLPELRPLRLRDRVGRRTAHLDATHPEVLVAIEHAVETKKQKSIIGKKNVPSCTWHAAGHS